MRLRPMKFGEFQWPHNPSILTISRKRDIQELKRPFSTGLLQDRGAERRIVEGEGEFFGKDCVETYRSLAALLEENGAILSLPDFHSFPARLVSLTMMEKPEPELVHYRFVFWEDGREVVSAGSIRGRYVCQEGENLWSVAARFGTTADKLLELNPQIRWPNHLAQGEEVALP